MAFNTEEDRFCLVGHSFKLPFYNRGCYDRRV